MPRKWGTCALLAVCIASLPLRCSAECDSRIENKIRSEHRDAMEFIGVLDSTLVGEYQIALMSSGPNIANKEGKNCVKMEFIKAMVQRDSILKYKDVINFKVSLNEGALTAIEKDQGGMVKITHRFAYVTKEVIGLYVCSDAPGDPSMSLVAVASFSTPNPHLINHQVKKAREALERAGVNGFATIPYCPPFN